MKLTGIFYVYFNWIAKEDKGDASYEEDHYGVESTDESEESDESEDSDQSEDESTEKSDGSDQSGEDSTDESEESDRTDDESSRGSESDDSNDEQKEKYTMNERTFSGSIKYTIDQDVDFIAKSCRFLGNARFIFDNNSTVKFEDCEFSGPVHFEYHGKNSSSIERCIFFGRTKTICHRSSSVKFVGNLCYGSVSFDGNVQVKESNCDFYGSLQMPIKNSKKTRGILDGGKLFPSFEIDGIDIAVVIIFVLVVFATFYI